MLVDSEMDAEGQMKTNGKWNQVSCNIALTAFEILFKDVLW
jgi:hypothetical protein